MELPFRIEKEYSIDFADKKRLILFSIIMVLGGIILIKLHPNDFPQEGSALWFSLVFEITLISFFLTIYRQWGTMSQHS
ncbi:MAG: hypothetical protein KAU14_07960, partial [Thermoplasmata archaeon]|nr:hypothetical protein [Thermoplasmata archaeon]